MVQQRSAIGALVQRHDPDRFFTSLFAPPERREALWILYAFNHELARAREVVSQPILGLMRLQWWREVVEGADRRHEVATPLTALILQNILVRDDLLAMIAAREVEADEAIPTLAVWRSYVEGGAGTLAVAAGRALGADGAVLAQLRALGAAYGVAGLLRGAGALARQGRCLLPEDILATHGLTVHDAIAGHRPDAIQAVLQTLAGEGSSYLRAGAGTLPRAFLAAGLPAVLARRDLRRLGDSGPRGLGDRLAVLLAAMLRRPA
jgi:phytoene synthase